MSSNNELQIKKEDNWYVVKDRDVETGCINKYVGKYKILENAIKKANKYKREQNAKGYYVEYGLNISI